MDDVTRLDRCARCGAALAPGSAGDWCDACGEAAADAPTIAAGRSDASGHETVLSGTEHATFLSGSEQATVISTGGQARAVVARGPRPTPGQVFGPYRIERPLGSGGMGDVYEAEHLEHRRRVALKILGQRLASKDDLERFLREGELAASINHPNTVYIYGSEEITGFPAIAMELLPGGTLKDLVQSRGPLPATQAVDLILQVIDGLEAAARAGILHRDIKPANCFIDRDGGVKVGDFGLSISTESREGAATGTFQGTPQFAPPEQLQGEALDVRADIYAVGATLFFLLTGHAPFEDRDLTTLISRVKQEAPRSPREMSGSVPPALAAVVTRCLAKDRADRPAAYDVLRTELEPFSSRASRPAPLGRRFIASVIDHGALVALNIPLAVAFLFQQPATAANRWTLTAVQISMGALYFAVFEGRWGAALGKRMCDIMVVRPDGRVPGFRLALARSAICQLDSILGLIPMAVVGAAAYALLARQHPGYTLAYGLGAATVQMAILFVTARRRNGFAAIQDLATATRVVRRRAAKMETVQTRVSQITPVAGGLATRRGPFSLVASLGRSDESELFLAADPRLKRSVWILERAPGIPPLPAGSRDVSRPARLRWLGGSRTAAEAWDAFEAIDGQPLAAIRAPQPWPRVKVWLSDLSVEIRDGLADGSLPALAVDRVWITQSGHARVLDFRPPGTMDGGADAQAPSLATAQTWLADVAARALTGSPAASGVQRFPMTLPRTGRALLDKLSAAAFSSADQIVPPAAALLTSADEIPAWRRVTSIALGGVATVLFVLMGLGAAFVMRKAPSSVEALGFDFQRLSALSAAADGTREMTERRALETYIAASYRSALGTELTWSMSVDGKPMAGYRPMADRILAAHPAVSPAELSAARATLGPLLDQEAKIQEGSTRRAAIAPFVVPAFMFVAGIGMTAAFGILFAFVFRGGLVMRGFGMAVVTRAGAPASRLRAGLRGLAAWAPAALFVYGAWAAGVKFSTTYSITHPVPFVLGLAGLGVFLAGAVAAAWRTARGPQDYIAGTWLVPR